jgi:hypothetical protein
VRGRHECAGDVAAMGQGRVGERKPRQEVMNDALQLLRTRKRIPARPAPLPPGRPGETIPSASPRAVKDGQIRRTCYADERM